MTPSELSDLVDTLRKLGADTARVEVKASVSKLPRSLAESVSALANGDGGIIILGLQEAEGFRPAERFRAKPIADALAGMCANDMQPPVRADIELVEFEGATVVTAVVPSLPLEEKPCYVKTKGKYGGSFIRTGDGDRKLSAYEIDRLEENRRQPAWDRVVVSTSSLEDLDPQLVAGLLKKERSQNPRVFGKKTDEQALVSLGVLAEDEDGQLRPLLGGLLALGEYPQQFFPRLNVTFAVYPGSDKTSLSTGQRFLDSATLSGPIPYLVGDVVNKVVSNMRVGGVVKGAFRSDLPDYPPVAVREAVTNALMHRDYSPQALGAGVQVNMYADRLEITNPGGLFGPVTIESLTNGTVLPASRNQVLSKLLESVPYPEGGYVAENRGSGYQEIERQLDQSLLPPPEPVDRLTQFSLTFGRRLPTEAERSAAAGMSSADRIVEYLRSHATATSKELAGAAGIGVGGARKVINGLIDKGIVERTEPARSPKQRYRLA
ncbi:Divergent AAA domain protein [Corynebacterium ciconiae DSM 44920]|uniref:ATP-binding protein n=1 Tax=Corynebacterium ciconiae TaxID=227319 RepID=UPI0003A12674|nr:ATP-binding protein [Corynebacterium ciconiae]WKD61848.1 Divergent AAA domain protein [Corynebacterium ciconiae DSM 44920]